VESSRPARQGVGNEKFDCDSESRVAHELTVSRVTASRPTRYTTGFELGAPQFETVCGPRTTTKRRFTVTVNCNYEDRNPPLACNNADSLPKDELGAIEVTKR
jgi:hypothetical protein